MDRSVLQVLSEPALLRESLVRFDEWTSRLARPTARTVVDAVSGVLNRQSEKGTVAGRFYRDAEVLRSAIHLA